MSDLRVRGILDPSMHALVPCTQSHCAGCPLEVNHGRRTGTLISYDHDREDGSPKVDILVVHDYVSAADEVTGDVLAGKGGAELRMALGREGLQNRVAYTNLVRCRPYETNGKPRDPTLEELAACTNHVWQDIRNLKPKVVVLFGPLSMRTLGKSPRWKKGIHEVAGEVHEHEGVKFFPIPSSYPWAFDKNPYRQRDHLAKMCRLLRIVVDDIDIPYARKGDTMYLGTLAQVRMALKKLRGFVVSEECWGVGLDSETEGLNKLAPNGVSCIQLAPNTEFSYVIPLDHFDAPWTPEERTQLVAMLAEFFQEQHPFLCYIAHESKFDIDKVYRVLGIKNFGNPVLDPIFYSFLNDENLRARSEDSSGIGGSEGFFSPFNLKALTLQEFNFRHYHPFILDIRSKGKFWTTPMREAAYAEGTGERELAKLFLEYCGMDGYGVVRLANTLRKRMDSRGYTRAFDLAVKFGHRATHLARTMERNGICIDRDMLSFLQGDQSPIGARIAAIPEEIWMTPECQETNDRLLLTDKRTAGMGGSLFGARKKRRIFDLHKRDHLVELFVKTCKLEPWEDPKDLMKPGTLPSMGKEFRAKHDYHPIIQLHGEYVGLDKLRTSYVNAISDYLTDPTYEDNLFDGRLHPEFYINRTLTGRFASAYPSVHQIPRSDNFAKQCIKSLIGAELGNCIIESDYAQAEVRWWAQLSGDEDFARMFWNMLEIQQEYYRNPTPENAKKKEFQCDVHRQVASIMYGKALEDISKDERQAAKSITFGAIYGQSAEALAILLKITKARAEELQHQFISRFKKAGPWLKDIEAYAEAHGYVEAPNGRRRHLAELFKVDPGGTKRQARNSPIQAQASDGTAEAAFLQQQWIEKRGFTNEVRIINEVHDAILQEVHLDYDLIHEVITATTKHMMTDVAEVMARDYGVKMIVPLVCDFKMGLRWGNAYEWDQGEDLRVLVSKLQKQTQRLREGTPFWHIAVEENRVKTDKDLKKAHEEFDKADTENKRAVAAATIHRLTKHKEYITSLPVAEAA